MVIKVGFEGKEMGNCDDKFEMEMQHSRSKFGEPEKRCREVEERCLALELEIRAKDMELEAVKSKLSALEGEKMAIEEEVKVLKKKKAALEGAEMDETMGGEFSLDERKVESDEESKVDQLIMENKVLECERNIALKEVEVWKRKCNELESRVLQLEGKLSCGVKDDALIGTREGAENGGAVLALRDLGSPSRFTVERREEMQVEGTPFIRTPQKRYSLDDSPTARLKQGIHAKKHLVFANERSYDKKIAPSTPAGATPSSIVTIDIVDSDEERDMPVKNGPRSHGKRTRCVDLAMDEEGTSCSKGNVPFVATPKRKRDPKVVTSDDECEDNETMPKRRVFKIENNENEDEFDDNITPVQDVVNRGENDSKCHDDDDNLPISQLKRNRAQGSIQELAGLQMRSSSGPEGDKLTGTLTRPRRRLVKSEQGKERGRAQEPERSPENRTTENDGNDTSDENESESDGGSLSSFIVDSSDVEDDVSEEDAVDDIDELEDASDTNLDFGEIISRLQS